MLDRADIIDWRAISLPLAKTERALGRLAHALESTSLHPAWLWRETARASTKIAQIAGHRVQGDRLMLHLAGLPDMADSDDTGLAFARRVFLTAAPLFRTGQDTDSSTLHQELFAPLWDGDERPQTDDSTEAGAGERLSALAHALASHAGSGTRPALIDLFLKLRHHGAARQLPPSLVRLALPLSLLQAGLMPKAAPGLLGGRLPLGVEGPVGIWLERGLNALAGEATGSARRLARLIRLHHAWYAVLAEAGFRSHARAPLILDLLAATPVLSASLAARHLDCTPQGAGLVLKQLVDLGVLSEATSRARWKIYLASDIALSRHADMSAARPLSFGTPMPAINREAIEATLDGLLADLGRASTRIGKQFSVS